MTTNHPITAPVKKVNYLNNRDILKQIHKSKTSYCSFAEKEYHQYDLIIDHPTESLEYSLGVALQPEQLALAKKARADRLSQTSESKIDPTSIPIQDLIFRVMTWDHIPLSVKEPRKTVKKKTAQDILLFDEDVNNSEDEFSELEDETTKTLVDDMVHVKVNFPPFQHFKLDDTDVFQCIGKSHWQGDLIEGSFSKTHGQITDKLARMYIMLCEKYAMKYNWRGYTYNEEMKGAAILQLTYVGLRFNEAKSANPFAYYTAAVTNSFRRVLTTEKRNQNIRDDILEMSGLTPSFSRQMQDYNNNPNE